MKTISPCLVLANCLYVSAQVSFDQGLIPNLGSSLPFLSLGSKVVVPQEIVESTIGHGNQSFSKANTELGVQFLDGARLVANQISTTGLTKIHPTLESLRPGALINNQLLQSILSNTKIFPVDGTKLSTKIGANLTGSQQQHGKTPGLPATYLTEIVVQRTVNANGKAIPVCGPGTQASFLFGSDGQIKGLTHQWTAANIVQNQYVKSLSAKAIGNNILTQLKNSHISNVQILKVDFCYYDSGEKFIQPAVRWTGKIKGTNGQADLGILGYTPASGSPPEPIPELPVPQPKRPMVEQSKPAPSSTNAPAGNSTITRRQATNINVGLYPMQGDQWSTHFDEDVHAFWGQLTQSKSMTFNRAQDYWAESRLFRDEKEFFVDKMDIALVVGHGNHWLFATDENQPGWDLVDYSPSNVPATGYGPGAGGHLAYLAIKACQVIPTPFDFKAADFHKAFDPWWPVFNGMHALLGYRTEGQVFDNGPSDFGKAIANGGAVVWSWLDAIYNDYPNDSYYDINTDTGNKVWWGRPSAVTVCGHSDDTVVNRANLGRPGCLQMWWFDYSG